MWAICTCINFRINIVLLFVFKHYAFCLYASCNSNIFSALDPFTSFDSGLWPSIPSHRSTRAFGPRSLHIVRLGPSALDPFTSFDSSLRPSTPFTPFDSGLWPSTPFTPFDSSLWPSIPSHRST